MEKLINEQIHKQLVDLFSKELVHPVEIILFTSDAHQSSEYMEQLLEEVCSVSDLLALQTHDYESNQQLAEQYHLDKAPGFVLAGREGDAILDYGIRFAGLPAQYEFNSLINGIITVSKRDSLLNPAVRQSLAEIKQPVHLMVFVTPT
ncbi:MAG TPA: hypothetical protein PLA37_05585 [Anaerolineaceae bacterium]|nr:hypothetical protein [Anaerolineaceae bacterium]HQJ02440.1 hypothetical protein [Anaerolineaceae bacterium]